MNRLVVEPSLAEIIALGRSLIAARKLSPQPSITHFNMAGIDLARFMEAHGADLLAALDAAMEMRAAMAAYFGLHSIESDAHNSSSRLAAAARAFDAFAHPVHVPRAEPESFDDGYQVPPINCGTFSELTGPRLGQPDEIEGCE